MSATLSKRLDQILPRITSDAFLSSEGIGNEIACYIFDYPAEDELKVRDHIKMMMDRFASHHGELSVKHLNLLEVVRPEPATMILLGGAGLAFLRGRRARKQLSA